MFRNHRLTPFSGAPLVTRRQFVAGSAAAGTLVALHPFSAFAQAGQAHLRLIETTDLHVHVFPYDYYADKPNDTMGTARTATLIRGVRAEATNSLLLDNGDFLQGNPMGDYIAYERGMHEGDVHPIITAMNVLGIECSTLGNHEFNYGLDFMDKVLAGAQYPIVCANLAKGTLASSARDDDLYLKPYIIMERTVTDGAGAQHPVKIGLIGFVPPQIMLWDAGHLEGKVMTRDIVEAAKAWVPEMREAGADIVVALSHSGIDAAGPSDRMENASLYVAGVEGIDAVFTGHQHLVFPGPNFDGLAGVDSTNGALMGKPGVMGGFWGSHMGLIDLLLEQGGDGWRVASFTSEARPIYKRDENRKVVPLVESQQDILDAVQGRPRGDARLCAPAGRQDLRAALLLLRARRGRSFGADREPGADLVRERDHEAGGGVQGSADPFRGGAVQGRRARAGRNIIPTFRRATSRSRTSPTSISIRTRCRRC